MNSFRRRIRIKRSLLDGILSITESSKIFEISNATVEHFVEPCSGGVPTRLIWYTSGTAHAKLRLLDWG